jgi:hypothetical protein
MSLPKDLAVPDYKYTYPSERAYKDESKSTLLVAQITDTLKSGADYGITDPQVTKAPAAAV